MTYNLASCLTKYCQIFTDFIRTFLEKLGKLNPDDSTSSIGREAYTKTLASYHSFFIRQGAYIAMYTLPTQKVLLQRVSIIIFFTNELHSSSPISGGLSGVDSTLKICYVL